MISDTFSMQDLAQAWSRVANKEHLRLLPKIFGLTQGSQIFMAIMQGLLDNGLIGISASHYDYDHYDKIKKKTERKSEFRSLDDDWM